MPVHGQTDVPAAAGSPAPAGATAAGDGTPGAAVVDGAPAPPATAPSGAPPDAAAGAAASAGRSRAGLRRARTRRVAGTVVAVGFVSFFTDASAEMVTAVLPLFLITQLGLTPLQYGLIDGLYQGVTVTVRLVGGYLGDRLRHPKLIAGIGYGLSTVTKLAFLGVGSAASTGLVVAADRTGKGLRTAPRDAIIAGSTRRRDLGRAFGVHRAFDTAGAMIGPLLAFLLLAALPGSFDSVFVTSFWLAVVGVAVLLLFVPGGRGRRRGLPPVPLRRAVGLLRNGRIAALVAVAGLLAALTVSDGFIYLSLLHRMPDSASYFPLFATGMSAAYLLLAVPVGRLADRFGRWRVFLCGHISVVAAYLVLLGTPGGIVSSIACLALLGSYYAATDGVLSAATVESLPPLLHGSGTALVQTAVATGRLISPILFGLLWTRFGWQPALAVFTGLLAAALPGCWVLLARSRKAAPPAIGCAKRPLIGCRGGCGGHDWLTS